MTRDAFLLFYDEFPLEGSVPGLGGGSFNGAQEFAFNKTALEKGRCRSRCQRVTEPQVNVASQNMGLMPTPDGNCAGVLRASTAGWR